MPQQQAHPAAPPRFRRDAESAQRQADPWDLGRDMPQHRSDPREFGRGMPQQQARPASPPPSRMDAERAQRMAQASSVSPEQYMRNQAQMQRQMDEHEQKLQAQRERQAQHQPRAQAGYTDLEAVPKRKAPAPSRQIVRQAPPPVVIPPDVTVRQLAQLLGQWSLEL